MRDETRRARASSRKAKAAPRAPSSFVFHLSPQGASALLSAATLLTFDRNLRRAGAALKLLP